LHQRQRLTEFLYKAWLLILNGSMIATDLL
jgi:hypothetical protein